MIPIPSFVWRYGGALLAICLMLGGVWLHGRGRGVDSMRGKVAEAKAETVVIAAQRDQCRRAASVLSQQIADQNEAILEWQHAAESYREELTSALNTPPAIVYREVLIINEDCTSAVVELAGVLDEALQ